LTLPDTIPVKYTEEDAEFLSVRPVVRQTFRRRELLDMILSVTGKDPARVQKVLQAGTVVFHFFRYRWEGFVAEEKELAAALAEFPDADPARTFAPELCSSVVLDTGAHPPPEWKKHEAQRRHWWRRKSFWLLLLELAQSEKPTYASYSYERKGDLYAVVLTDESRAALLRAAKTLLPAAHRGPAASLLKARCLLYLCPR